MMVPHPVPHGVSQPESHGYRADDYFSVANCGDYRLTTRPAPSSDILSANRLVDAVVQDYFSSGEAMGHVDTGPDGQGLHRSELPSYDSEEKYVGGSSISASGGMLRLFRYPFPPISIYPHNSVEGQGSWTRFETAVRYLGAKYGLSTSGLPDFGLSLGSTLPCGPELYFHGTSPYCVPLIAEKGAIFPNVASRKGPAKGLLGSSAGTGPVPSAWSVSEKSLASHWATLIDLGHFEAFLLGEGADQYKAVGWYVESIAVIHRKVSTFEKAWVSTTPQPVVGFLFYLRTLDQAKYRLLHPAVVGGFSAPTLLIGE